MEQLREHLFVHHVQAMGFDVADAVVLTPKRVYVFDTSVSPQAIAPVRAYIDELGADRQVLVVNSHHHWDHVYGNASFAEYDIVAQRACPRLLHAQKTTAMDDVPPEPSEGVTPPTITFGDRLAFSDGSNTVHLIHTPGHSDDSIVLYLDNDRILLGGDTVEWPLPCFTQRDCRDIYIRSLRLLKQLPLDLVVPSHGPAMGKPIIDANERYVTTLFEAVEEAAKKGVSRHEMDLPPERFLPEGVVLDETYRRAHADNVAWAYDEL
jgi:glyoxylase-like metal-dependent hydrolase (beta-lactamase superfamily II)